MIGYRRIGIISCLLLAACAPKPPISETTENLLPPSEAETPLAQTETSTAGNPGLEKTKLSEEKQVPGVKTSTAVENSKKNLAAAKISSWEISGAMAARSKGKGWSASVNWLQQGLSSYQIRLSGPLGSGTVLISRSGGTVTLRDGPKTATSSNAESLLMQQTGVRLPVNNLYYWARGVPAPGAVQGSKYDQGGRLLILRQAGYTIEYQQYTSVGNVILPSNIRLQGNGIFIKLVIKNWRI
ncbi:Outer-membrane lipoprotein LolB precursor [Legionella massiliensis]|uniref:Outer-membrane lipoprotein LolB n=1 Tax=Legionella massiliensis TaxID=1034943 RepID=A0A078KVY7_9GAMM|nr:lipoprotein insertase outer membrane protein LolB [Legionella massiliensis]CDZ75868.1 Outer-membrane lipoprotein LolB precursor [Legionella massiliensis]CEE11606.1 Outer-membrane lipoprotein LolB precursor [Legionella massiliensis]